MCENLPEKIVIQRHGHRWTLTLRGDVDIYSALGFHQSLLELLEEEGDVVVVCGEVEQVDTSALQILLAFAEELRFSHRRLTFRGMSAPLRETLSLAGLTDSFATELAAEAG